MYMYIRDTKSTMGAIGKLLKFDANKVIVDADYLKQLLYTAFIPEIVCTSE